MSSVSICGVPHSIVECEDTFNVDTHFGMINYLKAEIRINKELKGINREETLAHEIVHGMLIHMGYTNLANDEQFVQALGNAICHSFSVKEIQDEKQG